MEIGSETSAAVVERVLADDIAAEELADIDTGTVEEFKVGGIDIGLDGIICG